MYLFMVLSLYPKNHKMKKIDPSVIQSREQDAAYEINPLFNKGVSPSFYFQPRMYMSCPRLHLAFKNEVFYCK